MTIFNGNLSVNRKYVENPNLTRVRFFSSCFLRCAATLIALLDMYTHKCRDICMDRSYPSALQLHTLLKCLSKCHVVIGLILLVLAALADYVSYRVNTLRMCVLAEVCALYFIITGITGIVGSASHRRGLIIAFTIMIIHAITIFAPAIIISSSFDIHFYRRECWGSCDWNLLSASVPKDSRCQILCGENVDRNLRSSMTRLGTDYRIDAGLISLTILEFFLSIFTTIICFQEIFGNKENQSKREIMASSSIELKPLNAD